MHIAELVGYREGNTGQCWFKIDHAVSFIIWGHLIVNVSDEGYSHLCCVIASKNITDEVCFDLHVDLDTISASKLCLKYMHEIIRASTRSITISSAPLNTPTSIFENHNSSCARPSSGSSTKSAKGFSSNMRENCLLSLDQFVILGVMFKKILKPT